MAKLKYIFILLCISLVSLLVGCDVNDKQYSILSMEDTMWRCVKKSDDRITTVEARFYKSTLEFSYQVISDDKIELESYQSGTYTYKSPSVKIQMDETNLIGYVTDNTMNLDNGLIFYLTSSPMVVGR